MRISLMLAASALPLLAACVEESCTPKDRTSAVMAETFVARSLKSPSTADFGPSSQAHIVDMEECVYEVTSYVDAQNGFGGTIRSGFTLNMTKHLPSGQWSASDLFFH